MESLPFVTFPDVEQLVVGFLAESIGTGPRFGTELPEHLEAALPVVAVSRVGGAVSLDYVLEEPSVDIEVVAADKGAAHDLAQQVRAWMLTMASAALPGARVYQVVDINGLTWMPDPVTELPRYIATFELHVRPA